LIPDNVPVLVTCEHAGNTVPPEYRYLFRTKRGLLTGHRGYDRGALGSARIIAVELHATLLYHNVTRLLIDVNRSDMSPSLFSDISRSLKKEERKRIKESFYRPYRSRIERAVEDILTRNGRVLHISVHSFVPMLKGEERKADIGLLYDPSRPAERDFCIMAQRLLKAGPGGFIVRRNYPYLGKTDGMVTHLRKRYPADRYAGVELEVNQKHMSGPGRGMNRVVAPVAWVFREIFRSGLT